MIAIIPARGGSKGVPNKNIRELNGKPLIYYTIQAAVQADIFKRIIVSTDSTQIAEISEACGAEIPFIRPRELSQDSTSSDDVILHALDFFSKEGLVFEEVCKLQPTSPLRTAEHIRAAYDLLHDRKKDFLVSVCECEHSPLWSGVLDENASLDCFISDEVKRSCRQQLKSFYRLNGAIYMANTQKFMENRNFLGHNGIAYVMPQADSIDIDSELDFGFAEYLMNRG